MSSVDRIVTATLPPEPGHGSVVLVDDGGLPWVAQRLPDDVAGYVPAMRRHWVGPALSSRFGNAYTWLELLSQGRVRVIWDVDLDAEQVDE